MTAASRRLGRDGEIPFLKYAREVLKFAAERLRLTGRNDEGDIAVDIGGGYHVVVECKNVKTADLADFVRQAEAEAINYAVKRGLDTDMVYPLVVMKRRGTGDVGKWYALTTVENYPW